MNKINIEFRVWDTLAGYMSYADSPFYMHYGISLRGEVINLQNGAGGNELILQQFTGEWDINMKKIFEGDIVQYTVTQRFGEIITKHVGVVERFKSYFTPSVSNSEICEDEFYSSIFSEFLIVGNIYENPELI